MKKLNAILILTIIFCSCDPPRGIYEQGTIIINAHVINPQTNITLGDSVAFYFEVPDTVMLNGSLKLVTAIGNDGANNGFYVNKIIPSRAGGFDNDPLLNSCKTYASIGQVDNIGRFSLANINGKLKGKFYMIPQQKGVYFFEQIQEGYIDLNNGSIKARFNYNFGNINRNHQMLIDSAGASNNFGLFLQGKQGLEVYGFKVI